MNILCDNPKMLKEYIPDIDVFYSPALDIYTKKNSLIKTLKGLYVSSNIDFDLNPEILDYIKECSKKLDKIPVCYPCRNYEEFDSFCKKYLDNETELRVAYDVETTAAPFLSKKYKLAGFSLANCVDFGCYVILESIDYKNPDIDLCFERLSNIIKTHKMLVFNAQHEYIATKICVNTDLNKESVDLDDVYAFALTMKTESFKADVFKLKLLCNRLLGTENWASIIDDYIELALNIAMDDKYIIERYENEEDNTVWYKDKNDELQLNEDYQTKFDTFYNIIKDYGYNFDDAISFIEKIQNSYVEWQEQDTLPYTLIPSKMIMKYGCYDSCYLVELYNFFETWAHELDDKLQNALNKPNTMFAYKECVQSQIMSAILTINGIFISDEKDEEVRQKAIVEAEKYYNKLWEVNSDTTGKNILREYVKNDEKQRVILEKNYLLPKYLIDLIPDGWEFISTTPTFYSFLCKPTDIDLISWAESEGLKPDKNGCYKLLQKHLKPFSSLDDEDNLLENVLDDYFKDMKNKDGNLSVSVFKPMSSPASLFDILTQDLSYSKFISRVVLYEYENLSDKDRNIDTDTFLEEHLLFDFDNDVELYVKEAKKIKDKMLNYLSKQYSYKEIYENLVKNGIKSFASPIIAYIYDIFTATGCTVDNPKYSAFDFISRLKICRKYLKINSTYIVGSSGGYDVQAYIDKDSIDKDHLSLVIDHASDDKKHLKEAPENTNRVAFGSWYANTAETGRWQATVHNVPAGSFCKRRFVSRFKGGFILANDMSQAEVRELAAVSKCEKLLETVADPSVDIHRRTASLAFNVPYDEVTGTQRKQTKTGIFSIVYGREEQSLAQELFNGDKQAAKRLMDAIFKVYPEIPEYLQNAIADVRKNGYLVTRRGCPIFVNPYTQKDKDKGEAAWRRNIQNYSIQGGASHWCTGTLVNIQKLFDKYNLKSKICCYIHDSIEVDCHPEEFDIVFKILNYAFNELATKKYNVPTSSDTVCGSTMGFENEIKRIEKWHYIIEGELDEVKDTLKQFQQTYKIEIISKEVGEEEITDSVDWVFTPRAQLQWSNKSQKCKIEFKITPKV